MKKELSKKEKREQAENIMKNGPGQLKRLEKKRDLMKRKIALVEDKYVTTEKYDDNVNFEFQKDPEFLNITKEEKLLEMNGELEKNKNQIEQVKKVISDAKKDYSENRG